VRDGSFITAAGVSSGIDLALSLVEEQHGPQLAHRVLRQMILVQVRLLPVYVRLPFMPSTWSFAFAWAAVAAAGPHWLGALHPAGYSPTWTSRAFW
jgi:transcriptional regulator GlxA family with amidase domain